MGLTDQLQYATDDVTIVHKTTHNKVKDKTVLFFNLFIYIFCFNYYFTLPLPVSDIGLLRC